MSKNIKLLTITISFICILIFSFILICSQNVFITLAENDLFEYSQDFSDVNVVNTDFSAFYVRITGGRSYSEKVNQEEDGHWQLENSVLTSLVEEDSGASTEFKTEKYSILTYNKRQFLNFEVSVDYLMGDYSYLWPSIAFRQAEEGKTFFNDGGAVFIQKEGKPTLWGSKLVGGPYEGKAIANYDSSEWHNLKVSVVGNDAVVYVDNNKVYEKRLNASFYQDGYISLISVNNNSSFKNFKIKELEEAELKVPPVHKPIDSSNDSDSLDNLAKVNDDNFFIERPINSKITNDKAFQSWQLVLIIVLPIVVMGSGICVFFIIKKKRDKKQG